jgi:WXG100 family type VII secretion target
MAQISVTPDELKQQALVYGQASGQINEARNAVNNMNNTIAGEWQGAAFQSYLEQYNQLSSQVDQFMQLLESIQQQVTNYADTVAERDAQDAKGFGLN